MGMGMQKPRGRDDGWCGAAWGIGMTGAGMPRLRELELGDPTRALASVKLHFVIVNLCQTPIFVPEF
jgi:hypothetical protein